jgi:pimeloyl-ACP methyl ester carboxylesterase
MGGWAAAMTAESDPDVVGTILISPANMGFQGHSPREDLVAMAADNMETLAGVTPQSMADELIANKERFDWTPGASHLARKPLLVLTAEDGLSRQAEDLVAAVRTDLHPHVQTVHVATDHSWSSARIRLEQEVLTWLAQFETHPPAPAASQR